MELKFLIFLFITLPYINCGKKTPFSDHKTQLDEYARTKMTIVKNFLKFSRAGFMRNEGVGFVYAGQLKESGHPVAIKFVPIEHIKFAQDEIKIFKKLNAYENPKIEEIGIPNVYYYGAWNSYQVTAMTKLRRTLEDILDEEEINSLDMMILFRNFVIQTRQMHTNGICHGDVDSNSIMFGLNGSFLTDFKVSREMEAKEKFELTRKDWMDFLSMITNHYGITFNSENWSATKRELREHGLDGGLKTIMLEFGEEIFVDDDPNQSDDGSDDDSDADSDDESNDFPNYDYLEGIIHGKINEKHDNSGSPPTFSWLSN